MFVRSLVNRFYIASINGIFMWFSLLRLLGTFATDNEITDNEKIIRLMIFLAYTPKAN